MRSKQLLSWKENEVVREETVDGIKFVYHWGFFGGSFGCIDKNRVIHLSEPEFLVTLARSHELVHYRRWNKLTMRCYQFWQTKVSIWIVLASLILSLALLEFTEIPILLWLGLLCFFSFCGMHEEKIAMKEAKKMTYEG